MSGKAREPRAVGAAMAANQASLSHRSLSQAEVDAICARHERQYQDRPGGARAVFAWADIFGLNLRGRNLSDADFTGAVMCETDLCQARLDHAILFGADMQRAML